MGYAYALIYGAAAIAGFSAFAAVVRAYFARVAADGGTTVDKQHAQEVYTDTNDYNPTLIQSCDSGKATVLYSLLVNPQALLETFTGSAAAYSLRSLSAGTTNVVKVRRSGDDAELDFTATEVSDGTLAAWVTAGGGTEDGFVTTWYDQSGNGYNATQATAGNQPKIVSSGSLVTENGKAAIDFDGVDDSFALSNANLAISDYQISSVAYGANILGPIYCQGDNDGWSTRALIMRPSFGIIASSSLSDTLTVDYTSSSQILITYEHKSNTSNGEKVYVDGSFVTQVNSVGDVKNSTTAAIGHDYTSQYIDGTIQEIIIYNFDQSSNRTGIEANINDYYNIYP